MTSRYRVELMHQISIVYHWATNDKKDTISALSEKQARQLVYKLNEFWCVVERRKSHAKKS